MGFMRSERSRRVNRDSRNDSPADISLTISYPHLTDPVPVVHRLQIERFTQSCNLEERK